MFGIDAVDRLSEQWSDGELSCWAAERFRHIVDLVDTDPGGGWMNRVIKDYPDLDRLSRSAKDCLKGVLKGQNLIDLGCGRCPDNFAKSLINLFGIAGYIGVDISTIPQKRSLKGRPFEIARVLPPAGSLVVMHFDLDRFANQAGLRLQKTFNDGYLRIYQKN